MNIHDVNKAAWDQAVGDGTNPYTKVVSAELIAERDELAIEIIEGNMADLSAFEAESFELIFNPPSTMFVPNLEPVWRECHRVL